MPYTVGCTPAPLTFTIRPKLDWRVFAVTGWLLFFGYQICRALVRAHRNFDFGDIPTLAFIVLAEIAGVLMMIRRERVEIYPEQMIWRKTYFGITRSQTAPLADVLGVEWNEGLDRGEGAKDPDYLEFFLPNGSVKGCFGVGFEEFDRMREEIRVAYPELTERWARSAVRSKNFTLLNLN